jgi:hypothetical protein
MCGKQREHMILLDFHPEFRAGRRQAFEKKTPKYLVRMV